MNIIRKLISVFEDLYNHSSNSRFCRYLLKKGIKMGGGKILFDRILQLLILLVLRLLL